MLVDITDAVVRTYQTDRLKEKAAPKSVNEEVGFLPRLTGGAADVLRAGFVRTKR
jgi:hypothetical protein